MIVTNIIIMALEILWSMSQVTKNVISMEIIQNWKKNPRNLNFNVLNFSGSFFNNPFPLRRRRREKIGLCINQKGRNWKIVFFQLGAGTIGRINDWSNQQIDRRKLELSLKRQLWSWAIVTCINFNLFNY